VCTVELSPELAGQMFIFPLKPSRNDSWPCHFLFSFLDFFGIADVLIKAQQIIRTLSLSPLILLLSLYAKFIISGVDRIKQLFGMYALNLFLREVFTLRLAIKWISTSMGTAKNTLDKILWGQTMMRILDQSWTNTNPFIYMRNLNISYFSSFRGKNGLNDTMALLGLVMAPRLDGKLYIHACT